MRKKRQVLAVTVLSVVGAALIAPTAAVAGTLDQQQVDVSGGDSYVDSGQSLGQTFTAGLTGRLDQVDLSLRVLNAPTLSMTVQIRNVTAGQPGSTVLAAQTITPSLITGAFAFAPITFATPASVAAGTHYAIVAYSATVPPEEFSWARTTSDVYAGGGGLYVSSSPPSGSWLAVGARRNHSLRSLWPSVAHVA